MTIFAFMKKMNIKNKYVFSLVIISIMVAFLIHFPELVSLFDVTGQNALFPDMSVLDVANEVFFTFVSLLLLFAMNTYVFGFNRQKARISWQKVLLSFVMTWCVNNLLGKGFVFLHHQFDIPAIDALVHHYLHPLRDFIMSCVVTGSCYMIYLIRQSQQVQVENQQLRAENLLNQYEALKSQLNPHILLKMRYEDNLVFDIDLGKEHESKQLPPMSVQLLIENAVKHNEISNRHSLTISVRSDHDSLTVSNPIQPKLTHSGGTGIGLVNLSKRYNLLYKLSYCFFHKRRC